MRAPMAEVTAELDALHPDTYAVKAWLTAAIFRCGLYPKAIYLEIGVDQSTFSRWMSLEHDQSPGSGYLRRICALLDQQAVLDLQDVLTPPTKKPGANRA